MSSTTPTPVRPLTPEGFKSKDEAKKAFKVIILLGSILAFVDFFTIWVSNDESISSVCCKHCDTFLLCRP